MIFTDHLILSSRGVPELNRLIPRIRFCVSRTSYIQTRYWSWDCSTLSCYQSRVVTPHPLQRKPLRDPISSEPPWGVYSQRSSFSSLLPVAIVQPNIPRQDRNLKSHHTPSHLCLISHQNPLTATVIPTCFRSVPADASVYTPVPSHTIYCLHRICLYRL